MSRAHGIKGSDEVFPDIGLEELVDAIKDGITLIDRDFRIHYTNRLVLDMVGAKSQDDVFGRKCFEALFGRRSPCEWCNSQAGFETGEVQRRLASVNTPDGMKHYAFSAHPSLNGKGVVCHAVEVASDVTEKAGLESTIKRLATIANSSADAMMCVDLDSRFEFWNTGAEALFGFKRDEILGKNFHIIVPPELREAAEVKRRLALKKGFVRYETLRLKKDGTTVPVDMTLTVIADERGNPTGIAASIKDLSEKEMVESELREIKNHLESIFDTIQESICVIDKDLRIISFNESFAKNTGTPRENILGNKCYKVLHGYSEDEFLVHCRKHCIVREAFETGKPVESVHHHDTVEGQIFHESRALPTRNANGETYQIVYGINDVTEKKEAEQTLRFLAKIQGQVSEMIVTMALDHTLLTVNDAAQRTFGYSEDELVGQNASILVPEAEMENSNAFWDAISEKGFVEGYEGMRVTKNGRRFPTELSGVLVSGEGGASPYVIGVGRDITERKKAEKKLRDYADRLERSNKLKDLFADIMRHDLLNPLGVVKNVFEIIEEDLSDRGIEKEIAMVTRNVAKIEDLVHSAARFGQVESAEDMEFKNRNLKEILEEVVSGLSSEGLKKDMTIKIFQDDYYAETNPFIEDVFSNLITNAIKYSEAGSEIEASCEDLGDKLMISVSDRGMGVPDEHKQGIFERFKRVEKGSVKGSGLGLAIVKRVVELHNGDVWVEDRPDGGSTFAFTLPKKRDKDV